MNGVIMMTMMMMGLDGMGWKLSDEE